MRVLGIDPASSITALAVVQDGELKETMIWAKNPQQSNPWNLHNYFTWIKDRAEVITPHMVCIESLSVTRGAQVTRVLAFYQAASVIACKEMGLTVVEARVKTARRIVLGNGNLDKRETHDAIKKLFPKFKFKQFKTGGGDETDATVVALAGPDVAEI